MLSSYNPPIASIEAIFCAALPCLEIIYEYKNFFPDLRSLTIFPRINVGGRLYNKTMKKRKPPLNKVAQATRNAHSKELFVSLMLNKHLIVTPTERKGSRQANKLKAIKESN